MDRREGPPLLKFQSNGLLSLMRMEFDPAEIAKLRSVRYYGGLPIDARTVTDNVLNQEKIRQEGK